MEKPLGRLERVELRSIWQREDREFTPWLARAENLTLLGEAIGLELELEAQEKDVGPFSADLLCKNTLDGSYVLIENQLERTDHTHLGQLMTYAAGLDGKTVIWISSRFTDEHRAALDWLNTLTVGKGVRFFGLEIELWRIGDSAPAPQFKIVSQPNDWSSELVEAAKSAEERGVSETQALQFKYWSGFSEHLSETSHLTLRSPRPQNWADFSLGRTNAFLRIANNVQDGKITAGVYLYKNMKNTYDAILLQKGKIEESLGFSLSWENDPNKQTAVIKTERLCDIGNDAKWKEDHEWLRHTIESLDRVFRPVLRSV